MILHQRISLFTDTKLHPITETDAITSFKYMSRLPKLNVP